MSQVVTAHSSARYGAPRIDRTLIAVVVLLFVVMGTGFSVSPRFGSRVNFGNVFEQMAAVGFVSLGQTLVVLVGGIDLSIGALVSALSVLLAGLADGQDGAVVVGIVGLTLAAGAFVGFVNGLVVVGLRVHPLIVTIGMGAILNGITLIYARHPGGSAPDWLQEFAYGRILGLPTAGLMMIAIFLSVGVFLT